jgi:hypothetical protein
MDEVTLGPHTDRGACSGAVSVVNRTPLPALVVYRDCNTMRILRSETLAAVAVGRAG